MLVEGQANADSESAFNGCHEADLTAFNADSESAFNGYHEADLTAYADSESAFNADSESAFNHARWMVLLSGYYVKTMMLLNTQYKHKKSLYSPTLHPQSTNT